jgi:TatD DNase family protein
LKTFFNIHTHIFHNNNKVLELVNQYPNQFDATIPFYSIGVHPWYITENELDNDLKIIESKIILENCLAIGECGLDRRIDYPIEKQVIVFEKQLLLAKKYNKPVIVHCVAAFQELIEIKKRLQIQQPMILHGFSKNWETAQLLLKNGFYISFGKNLLQNEKMETVFNQMPNKRFFFRNGFFKHIYIRGL